VAAPDRVGGDLRPAARARCMCSVWSRDANGLGVDLFFHAESRGAYAVLRRRSTVGIATGFGSLIVRSGTVLTRASARHDFLDFARFCKMRYDEK
jgi:hypothetical protein